MWDILREHIGEESLTSRLTKQIIFHDPTVNPIIKRGTNFNLVPPHKSLWHCRPNHGLPIGNLTSQIFANVYLDGLDHYIKHTLKCRRYARYVDDAILMSEDREQLYEWRDRIDVWLKEKRELRLHPNKIRIAPVKAGICFVGRLIRPFHTTLRKITIGSMKAVALQLQKFPLDRELIASVNSYLGLMRHSCSFLMRQKLCQMVLLTGTIGYDDAFTKIYSIAL